jgi:hypothetical protein
VQQRFQDLPLVSNDKTSSMTQFNFLQYSI